MSCERYPVAAVAGSGLAVDLGTADLVPLTWTGPLEVLEGQSLMEEDHCCSRVSCGISLVVVAVVAPAKTACVGRRRRKTFVHETGELQQACSVVVVVGLTGSGMAVGVTDWGCCRVSMSQPGVVQTGRVSQRLVLGWPV